MRTTTLGRTGLRVGVAGLGSGGHSMLGQGTGASPARSVAIVERALDLGVTFFDTAPVYGTEEIVGKGIAGKRDSVVLSTKSLVIPPGAPVTGDRLISGADLARNIDVSLARLGTDYVDILHLHGVTPGQYERCRDELVPALLKLRDQGKIRFLGITERFIIDPQHRMLTQAVGDDCWDVMMVGFNLINPSARDRVLARTLENNIATLVMFAVRRVLSRPEALREMIADLVTKGLIADDALDPEDPLGFLVDDGGAESGIDAAYRFCRHEPGVDVVLTGTGSVDHLESNTASLQHGPLPRTSLERLRTVFGAIDSVSGD